MKINMHQIFYIISFTLILTSCKKLASVTSDVQVAQDVALYGKLNNNVQNIVNQSIQSNGVKNPKRNDGSDINGAIVTLDSSNKSKFIYTVSFDGIAYGTNGILISGSIIITTNGKKYFENGMVATVTTKGLEIDGVKFNDDLTMTIRNVESTSGYEDIWTFDQNYTLLLTNGKSIIVKGNGKRYQTAGYDTPDDYNDDAFKAEISANGTASNAVAFQISTTALLVKNVDCKYISAGTLEWNSNGSIKMIDFGNSTVCDNIAIITVEGIESKITL